MDIIEAGLIGFICEGVGVGLGVILLYFFHVKNGKMMGMLYGATSGLMLAMICFDILPTAFNRGKIEVVLCGIIIGTLLGLLLDEEAPLIEKILGYKEGEIDKAGILLAMGIAIHNMPEGFALGTMILAANESIKGFAFVMMLHSIPEGIAMAIPFIKAKTSLGSLLMMAFGLGIIMAVGAMLGYRLSGSHEGMMSVSLGIAAGIILYIVCDELIPEARKIWNGRLTTLSTILGLIIGIVLLQ